LQRVCREKREWKRSETAGAERRDAFGVWDLEVKEETEQNKKLAARATAQERSSFGLGSSERLATLSVWEVLTHSAQLRGELAVLVLTGRMPCRAEISAGECFLVKGLEAICRGEGRTTGFK
jgi:hypothetical protein